MAFLSVRLASIIALSIMGAILLFHVLVIGGVLPKTIVWGGQFSDPAQIIRMEIVSIVILLLAAAIFMMRWRTIAAGDASLIWLIGIWALVGLFALNTVGNLFAKAVFERAVMTPLTLVLALLALRLALEKVAGNG
jgi:hypothetical protein